LKNYICVWVSTNTLDETANAIGEALGVEPLWINEGSGLISKGGSEIRSNMRSENLDAANTIHGIKQMGTPYDMDLIVVPKALTKLSAGGVIITKESSEAHNYVFRLEWLKRKVQNVKKALLVDVEGDSMLPILRNADVVMLDLQQNSPTREGIYELAIGGVVQIKHITPIPNNEIRVTSNNPDYYDYSARVSKLKIIGRVVWHDRSLT
jgi:phage repressor protein C with HTH and peptisase S24 domain